jgi:filamentous hemagglutinin
MGLPQEAYADGTGSQLGENTSSKYSPAHPLNNIKDNPIPGIQPDNTLGRGELELDRAQNATPIVQINRPSDGGVSANYYKDFNVNQENLIINNAKGQAVKTDLGGVIYGNPNFNKESARQADIILNEVTSANNTTIAGYLEVAGGKADLIIANPNGIMVSGAGFINTGRISLITGRSGMGDRRNTLDSQGNLNPFMLSNDANSAVIVEGRNVIGKDGKEVRYNLGIDTSNISFTQLISRVVKINADILSNGPSKTDIEVISGGKKAAYNKDAKRFEVTSDGKIEGVKPEFAIDSTALGGIRAGKIKIIAMEEGVGARIRKDVISDIDNIEFDVNGNLIFEEKVSLNGAKDVKVKTHGKLEIGDKVGIDTNTHQAKIEIDAKGGIDNSSTITTTGDITIQTDNEFVNKGTISSAESKLNIDAKARIDNRAQGVVHSKGDMTIKTNNEFVNKGEIRTNAKADIQAIRNIDSDGLIQATGDIKIKSDNDFKGKGNIKSERKVSIKAKDIVMAGDDAQENLVSGQEVDLEATRGIRNIGASTLVARQKMNLLAQGEITNNGPNANIFGENIEATSQAGRIANDGHIKAHIDANLTSASISNTGAGKIEAENKVELKTTSSDISNTATIAANNEVKLNATGDLSNANTGQIRSNNASVLIEVGRNIRSNGVIYAGDANATLRAPMGEITNNGADANIRAKNIQAISRDSIANEGKMEAADKVELNSTALDISNTGTIVANNEVRLDSAHDFNNLNTGQIDSKEGTVSIKSGRNIGNSGNMYAQQGMTLSAAGEITNNGLNAKIQAQNLQATSLAQIVNNGNIETNTDANLTSKSISNTGQIQATNKVELNSTALDISNTGTITANNEVRVASAQDFSNANTGKIDSRRSVSIKSGRNIGNSGNMYAKQDMTLSAAGKINNMACANIQGENVEATSQDAIINNGNIETNTDANLTSKSISNTGKIQAASKVELNSTALDISNAGTIIANDEIKLDSAQDFSNANTGQIDSKRHDKRMKK